MRKSNPADSKKSYKSKVFQEALDLTDRIRQPAGPDARFANLESISQNMDDFVLAYNNGLGNLHAGVIREMFKREKKLHMSGKAINGDPTIHRYRRVNDALVWTGLGNRRHLVKGLCNWSPETRPVLGQANPNAVLAWLSTVDAQYEFPVWTDTTSFVGPGDVLLFGPNNHFRIVELKQIGSDIFSVPPSATAVDIKGLRKHAHKEVGQSAGDHIVDRLTKQVKKMTEADSLMRTGRGKHPFTQVSITMLENDVPEEHYGGRITKLVEGALKGATGTDLIEGCVWIAAYPKTQTFGRIPFLESAWSVFSEAASQEGHDQFIESVAAQTFSSTEMQHYPIVKPPPILPISRMASAALLTEQVTLLSYLDWDAFAELVNSSDLLQFNWESADEARKDTVGAGYSSQMQTEQAMPIVTPRGAPTLVHEHYSFQLGPPTLFRILGDFVLPSTVIAEKSQPGIVEELAESIRYTPR